MTSKTGRDVTNQIASLLRWLVNVGALVAGLAMVLFGAIGLWKIVRGALMTLGAVTPASNESGIVSALSGLEYLFLAPLAYLVLILSARLVAKAGIDSDEAMPEQLVRDTAFLKALISGLMIAIVATDLVSRVAQPDALTLATAAPRVLLIATLAAYVLVLEVGRRH